MNYKYWILILGVFLGIAAKSYAGEMYSATEEGLLETQVPQSIPLGFGGFDRDVLLGQEMEALDELDADGATEAFGDAVAAKGSDEADTQQTKTQ
jgi:hypothetical protein